MPAPTRSQAITDAVVGGAVGALGCLAVWALSETRWWYPSDWTLRGYLWAVVALGVQDVADSNLVLTTTVAHNRVHD